MLARTRRWLFAGLLMLLLAVGVGAVVVRQAAPGLVNDHQRVERWLLEQTGLTVRFQGITLTMRGWRPELRLHEVLLMPPSAQGAGPVEAAAPLARADRIRLVISLHRSVLRRTAVIRDLRVQELRLAVRRDTQGVLLVAGQPLKPDGQSKMSGPNWRGLLRGVSPDTVVAVEDAVVDFQDEADPRHSARFTLALHLLGRRGVQQLSARGHATGGVQGRWRAALQFNADTGEPVLAWSSVQGLALEQVAWLVPSGLRSINPHGLLDLDVWWLPAGNGAAGWGEVRGSASVNDLRFTPSTACQASAQTGQGDGQALAADASQGRRIALKFALRPAGQGLSMRLADLHWYEEDKAWQARGIDIAGQPGEGLAIAGDYLDVGALGRLMLASGELPCDLAERLGRLQPGGIVKDYYGSVRQAPDLADEPAQESVASYRFDGRFTEARWRPLGDTPGVEGLAGELHYGDTGGWLRLAGDAPVKVGVPGLFSKTLEATGLFGNVQWRREAGVWQLRVPELWLRTADFRSRLGVDAVLSATAAPRLELTGDLWHLPLTAIKRYLPDGKLPPKALAWLRGAFRGGEVVKAHLAWRNGPALAADGDEGLSDGGKPAFTATALVADADLDYAPGKQWPALEQLQVELSAAGRNLSVRGQGRILNSRVERVDAELTGLGTPQAKLRVVGKVIGEAADALKFMQISPLRHSAGKALADWRIGSGRSLVDLDLKFGLGGEFKATSSGRVALQQVALEMRNLALVSPRVDGTVVFGPQGVNADRIDATLFGGPAQLRLTSRQQAAGRSLVISGTGKADAAALARYIGVLQPGLVSGESEWRARVSVAKAVDIALRADLAHVQIDAPSPLGRHKQAGALSAKVRCPPAGCQVLWVDAAIDDTLSAALELRQRDIWQVTRGVIAAGVRASLPESGTWLRGRLPRLDYSAWQAWLDRFQGDGGVLAFSDLSLDVDQLRLLGRDFHPLRIDGHRAAGRWQLALSGDDAVGQLDYAGGEKPRLALKMERLHLPSSAQAESAPETAPQVLDPRLLPAIEVQVDDFRMNDRELGHLGVSAAPDEKGLVIGKLELRREDTDIQASGAWLAATAEWPMTTQVNGTASTGDFGVLLEMLGQDAVVAGGQGEFEFTGSWPGAPADFRLASARLSLSGKLSDGSVIGLEPGVGRLLGILNPATLGRRLSLNFKDVIGEGLVFDRVKVAVDSASGRARIRRFDLRGPAVELQLSGDLDLVSRSYDLMVRSEPKITPSLPLAGAIGSLGVGAALYLGQKVLAPEIARFTTSWYRITGSWDAPVVRKVARPASRETASDER